MHLRLFPTSLLALATVTETARAQCIADNCLRALRNSGRINSARDFCSSYTAAPTWTAPLPTYVSSCSSAVKISSACSCIATSSSSGSTATTSATTTSPSTSSPISTGSSTSISTPSSSATTSISECNTAPPVTSTVTITSNSSSTGTVNAYPSDANPGATYLPNPNFEAPIPSPPTDYCKNIAASAQCSIVQLSDPGFPTRFPGFLGSGMLRASVSNSEGRIDDFGVKVTIVNTPHPQGRDWRLMAYYRSDYGNPFNCWPIMGWQSSDGFGFGYQPDYTDDGTWQRFSRDLPGSAGGRSGEWTAYVTSGCYPGAGHMYIDGVAIY